MSERKPQAGDDNQVDIVLQDYLNDLLVMATAAPEAPARSSAQTVAELKPKAEVTPESARPVTYAE